MYLQRKKIKTEGENETDVKVKKRIGRRASGYLCFLFQWMPTSKLVRASRT